MRIRRLSPFCQGYRGLQPTPGDEGCGSPELLGNDGGPAVGRGSALPLKFPGLWIPGPPKEAMPADPWTTEPAKSRPEQHSCCQVSTILLLPVRKAPSRAPQPGPASTFPSGMRLCQGVYPSTLVLPVRCGASIPQGMAWSRHRIWHAAASFLLKSKGIWQTHNYNSAP